MHLAQMRAREKGEASALSLIGGKIGFPATDPASTYRPPSRNLLFSERERDPSPSPLLLLLDAVVASSSSQGAGIAYFIPCSVDASRRNSCCFALCNERRLCLHPHIHRRWYRLGEIVAEVTQPPLCSERRPGTPRLLLLIDVVSLESRHDDDFVRRCRSTGGRNTRNLRSLPNGTKGRKQVKGGERNSHQ